MDEPLLDHDDVRSWLARHVYAPTADPPPERVGLEAELFPFWVTRDGRPAARLALVELIAIVDGIEGATRNPTAPDGRPSWQLAGALITEEPGAQIEVAGPPLPSAGEAVDALEQVVGRLAEAFTAAGAGLAAAGLDCWSAPHEVPVQLNIDRYRAMTAYFERRGEAQGHLMMCSSCSLQVNVDLGAPGAAERRWLLANLAAPVLTAAFAASPRPGVVNGRAMGWLGLDRTRTGLPPPLVAGIDDPLEHALADALRADVLLVQRDGRALPGEPGLSFADWVASPHPVWGRPTGADLAVHLTTLFPEARLRGFLEVRGIDELPAPWRGAAVALLVGLLYDAAAREEALAVLAPHRPRMPQLLERAARRGLGDPLLAALAEQVLGAGLVGAGRLGIPHTADAERYLERWTVRARSPSDELRAALAQGPAPAFRWARC